MAVKRSRAWVFTVNNYTDESVERLNKLVEDPKNITQMVVGKEQGASGTPHLQGYIRFKNPLPRNSISKKIPNAWVDIANGTLKKNFEYCTKEHDILINYGDFETQEQTSKNNGQQLRVQYESMWEDIKEGKQETYIGDTYPMFYFKHLNSIRSAIIRSQVCLPPWSGDLTSKNLWIHGPTGCGKSRWAHNQCTSDAIYFKNKNKWWDGYDATRHKIVLIEDFLTDGKLLENYLKIWADRYSFQAEVKGGSIQIHPSNYILIITSNHSIEKTFLFCNPVDVEAINRRFHEIAYHESPLMPSLTVDLNILN